VSASLLFSGSAWGLEPAQPPSRFLTWDAPEQCPDADGVTARVRELAGDAVVGRRDRSVGGTVERGEGGGWRLSLDIASSSGVVHRRTLKAEHCDELAEAAAVAIAIAFGSEARGSERSNPEHEATAAEAVRPSLAAATLGVEDAAASGAGDAGASDGGIGVGASVLLDSGSVAPFALGAALSARARFERVNASIYGVWLPERTEEIAPAQGIGFSLLAAGLRGCHLLLDSATLEAGACIGFELGALQAVSHGLLAARDRRDTWLAPTLGLEVAWHVLPNLSLGSRLEAAVPIEEHRYVVDRDDTVRTTPDVALRWSLGIEADLISAR
jgi:hypothetical protein